MSAERDRDLHLLIREGLPPLGEPSQPPNLWPRLQRRLGARARRRVRLDWVLALAALWLLILFPETWLVVLYHF